MMSTTGNREQLKFECLFSVQFTDSLRNRQFVEPLLLTLCPFVLADANARRRSGRLSINTIRYNRSNPNLLNSINRGNLCEAIATLISFVVFSLGIKERTEGCYSRSFYTERHSVCDKNHQLKGSVASDDRSAESSSS